MSTDYKTLTDDDRRALTASVKKYRRYSRNTPLKRMKFESGDCALCDLYFHLSCLGCPVREHTDRSSCYGTPFNPRVGRGIFSLWSSESGNLRQACADEADFLQSLLDNDPGRGYKTVGRGGVTVNE